MRYLQRNNLRGELPLSWGAGPIGAVLHHVDLSDNSVEGNLPASWSGMQRLTKLRLSENNLQVQYTRTNLYFLNCYIFTFNNTIIIHLYRIAYL